MNPLTLLGLLQEPRFLTGAAVAVVGALAVFAAPKLVGWFTAWAVAAVAGLAVTGFRGWPPQVEAWMLGVAMVTTAVVPVAAASLRRRTEGWVPPILFAFAVLGVWGTVPDTEHARVLMGVTATMAIVALSPKGPRWTLPGLALATAVMGYVVMVDGWPRHSAVIGACGSVGMLVVAPIVLALRGSRSRHGRGRRRTLGEANAYVDSWGLIAAQVVLVILSGRLAGRAESGLTAAVLLVGSYLAVGLGWGLFTARRGG